MEIKTEWKGEDFLHEATGNLQTNMNKAGFYATNQLKVALNRTQPMKRYVSPSGIYYKGYAPSLPGENPKRLSGKFQRSIAFTNKDGTLTVGSTLDGYPKFLQQGTSKMAARPWMTLFLKAHTEAMARIILTGKPT